MLNDCKSVYRLLLIQTETGRFYARHCLGNSIECEKHKSSQWNAYSAAEIIKVQINFANIYQRLRRSKIT